MENIKKWFIIFVVMGCAYSNIELLFRGYTHPSMIIVGGLCGLLIGMINEGKADLKIWQQCAISTFIVLIIEFISGYILNVKLNIGVWDYSDRPFNIMGQVCLLFGVLWFFLSVVAIWLDDFIRFKFFGEKYEGNLGSYFKRLITLK